LVNLPGRWGGKKKRQTHKKRVRQGTWWGKKKVEEAKTIRGNLHGIVVPQQGKVPIWGEIGAKKLKGKTRGVFKKGDARSKIPSLERR